MYLMIFYKKFNGEHPLLPPDMAQNLHITLAAERR